MERVEESGDRSSLPRMLSTLYKRGFTGRLEITDKAEKSTIFFRKGRVVKAQRPDGLDTLELVLTQERLVTPRAIAEANQLPNQSEEEVAATLVRTGAAKKETLLAGLVSQLHRQLMRLFFADAPRMDAVAAEHPFRGKEAPLGVELDARTLIFPGIRSGYDDGRLARELAQIAGARVRLNAVSPQFLRDSGFPESSDPTIADLGGTGIEISETWLRTPIDRKKSPAKAIVLGLHCLDLLDINRQTNAADAPAAPRKRTGVTGLNALDPATILQMAESFFKNGDTPRSERAFAIVLKSDANNKRALAFTAWINYWKQGTNRTLKQGETTRAIRESIRADPKFAYGHFFYGSLLKLANDNDTAIKAFKAALEADPTLTDAERELRLLTMRKK